MTRMALIQVRSTVLLPPAHNERSPAPGDVLWVDVDDPFVVTQLSVGHLVPIGPIPKLDDEPPKS